jgi:hypothetical protein
MTKLDDLIAKIKLDVVIRRTKSGKATVEGPKQRAMREARERSGTDPALRALISASNATAKGFLGSRDPYANFREIAHAPLLQRQICRCCGQVQVNIAAELLHLQGRPSVDAEPVDVWIRRSTIYSLPIEEPLWAPTQSVAHCVACIETSREIAMETFGPLGQPTEVDGQLPLIH